MKNVLVIYYSQSGQLESIARNIAKPFLNSEGMNVVFYEIQMEKPFPFPWNKTAFFDVFPESFLQIPSQLKPIPSEILNTKFDLILLHFQVWDVRVVVLFRFRIYISDDLQNRDVRVSE